jgi:hypothetical protein
MPDLEVFLSEAEKKQNIVEHLSSNISIAQNEEHNTCEPLPTVGLSISSSKGF